MFPARFGWSVTVSVVAGAKGTEPKRLGYGSGGGARGTEPKRLRYGPERAFQASGCKGSSDTPRPCAQARGDGAPAPLRRASS